MADSQRVISAATAQSNGILTHTIVSPYQAGEVKLHVLLPETADLGPPRRVLYVLPVEPLDGHSCGDGLGEVRRHDLHNRHRLVFVQPTFSNMPWYADHPSDPRIQQETHLLEVVVPFVDRTYGGPDEAPRRLLLGFSKSGFGAFALLLRHPELFEMAAAFDAPLAWESPNRYGMSEVFETQERFDRYCVVDLLERRAEELRGAARLALFGYSDFRGQHQFLHYHLLKLEIPHVFQDGPRREHTWDSGWLPEAVQFLAGDAHRS